MRDCGGDFGDCTPVQVVNRLGGHSLVLRGEPTCGKHAEQARGIEGMKAVARADAALFERAKREGAWPLEAD